MRFGEGFLELRGGIPALLQLMHFGEGFLKLWGGIPVTTTANEFGEGFLELWGGIPALLQLMNMEGDSWSSGEGFLHYYS